MQLYVLSLTGAAQYFYDLYRGHEEEWGEVVLGRGETHDGVLHFGFVQYLYV